MSSAVFLFFFFTVIIYWFFGFKYWIISIEIPRFLNEEYDHKTLSETKYTLINIVAITVIVATCFTAVYFRWLLSRARVGVPDYPDHTLYVEMFTLYVAVAVICILAALFLADALRRLRNQI